MNQLKSFAAYTKIFLVALLLAFNYKLFIVVNSFAPAGLNGIATMIQYKTGFSIGYMSLLINIPLCILAYYLIDRMFAKRTLVFCLVYSFSYLYLQKIEMEAFQYNAGGHDTIFPVILSGVLSGFVYGVCFRSGGCAGGTDIVSKYISKKRPYLNFFWVTFSLNTVVAICSFFVYAKPDIEGKLIYDYKPVCLCILYCFISSYIGNMLIKGSKSAVKFTVITSHADEITNEIIHSLRHSSTQITARGAYSHDEKEVIICVINKNQIVDFKNMLQKYPDTFSFFETVNETYGNFKKIK